MRSSRNSVLSQAKKTRYLHIFALASLIGILGGCAGKQAEEPIKETRLMLNTFCTITVYGEQNREILAEAFDLCAEYEALLSMTVEGSDVWRINHAGGEPVDVAPQTAEVIKVGLEYGELSDGKFDITIGRLSRLWDFNGQSGVPSESEIAFARDTVDYRQVSLDGNTVRISNPDTWLDLGGIAKGYIADKIADFLKVNNIKAAVVDLGGNIVAVGEKPDGSPWQIGVRSPFGGRNGDEYVGIVKTGEASVVSSGTYERRFEDNGVHYHHILDPNTGMPANTDIAGATVLSEDSIIGDVLSTIIILIGSDKAPDIFSEVPGFIGAAIVLENGEVMLYGDIDF